MLCVGSKSGGTAATDPQADTETRQEFENLKKVLENGQEPKETYRFKYKKKANVHWKGGPLHLACVQPPSKDVTEVVDKLLKKGEDYNAKCEAEGTFLTPLHLAAGSDNVDAIAKLVEAGAEPDSMSLLRVEKAGEPVEHFTPMHEAVYFSNLQSIQKLLEKQAQVDVRNKDMLTPLHIAAKAPNGRCAEVASLLVRAKANVSLMDKKKEAPLITATMTAFPKNKLHLLSNKSVHDILAVADKDPETAAELMKDTKGRLRQADVFAQWRPALSKDASVKDLIKLLKTSPHAFSDVLEVLSVEPHAASQFHYAVPAHAQPERWGARRCVYVEAKSWAAIQPEEAHTEPTQAPAWHQKLCRGSDKKLPPARQEIGSYFVHMLNGCARRLPGRDHESVRVKVKVLMLPDIVRVELLFSISTCSWNNVFSVEAVRALLDHVWMHIAIRHYIMHFVYRMFELLVLILIAKWPPTSRFWRDASWSLLCTTSTREILMEYSQIRGYSRRLKKGWAYVNWSNLWDVLSMGLLASVVWLSVESRDFFATHGTGSREVSNGLLAAVCFIRWVQILYMMRAFEIQGLGLKLVPLVQSFFNVVGISFVTLLLFCAFTHAFTVMLYPIYGSSDGPTWSDNRSVVLQAYRLLFAGDGDGIDFLLTLTGREDGTFLTQFCVIFAYTTFGIFLLNLFIAVHGNAFEAAEDCAWELFYKERARMCLAAMLQPAGLQPCLPMMEMMDHYIVLIILAPALWIALIRYELFPHPVIPSLLFCLLLRLGDRMLLARSERRDLPEVQSLRGRCQSLCRCRSRSEKVANEQQLLADQTAGSGTVNDEHKARDEKVEEDGGTAKPEQKVSRVARPASSTSSVGLSQDDEAGHYLWWCGWQSTQTRDASADSAYNGREEAAIMGKLMQMSERMTNSEATIMRQLEQIEKMHIMEDKFKQMAESTKASEAAMMDKLMKMSEQMTATETDVNKRLANVESKLDALSSMGSKLDMLLVKIGGAPATSAAPVEPRTEAKEKAATDIS